MMKNGVSTCEDAENTAIGDAHRRRSVIQKLERSENINCTHAAPKRGCCAVVAGPSGITEWGLAAFGMSLCQPLACSAIRFPRGQQTKNEGSFWAFVR